MFSVIGPAFMVTTTDHDEQSELLTRLNIESIVASSSYQTMYNERRTDTTHDHLDVHAEYFVMEEFSIFSK